jgi:hypothetical protein
MSSVTAPASTSQANRRSVLISGATGFIGGHVVRRFLARGDTVTVLARNPGKARDRLGPEVRIVTSLDALARDTPVDAIINLAGAPILARRWTRGRRQELLASRLVPTQALVEFAGRLANPPPVFVSASAIGYYGVHADEPLDERAGPQAIFQSEICSRWEAVAVAAQSTGTRVVLLRLGVVLGRDGGALPSLATPVRLGLGGVLGTGHQWLSWIHVGDVVRLIEFVLDNPAVHGPLNAVAPAPETQRAFQQALAKQLHRPLWLRVPAVVLRLGLGEMSELLVDGQKVLPAKALAAGFEFRYPQLEAALNDLLSAAAASKGGSAEA